MSFIAYNLKSNKMLSFLGFLSQVFEVGSSDASFAVYHKTSCRADICEVYKAKLRDCHSFWFVSSYRISGVPFSNCVIIVSMFMSICLVSISKLKTVIL